MGSPSRREFLRRLGLATGAALAAPSAGLARPASRDPGGLPVPSLESGGTGPPRPPGGAFDLHAHPGLFAAHGTPLYLGDEASVATVQAAVDAGMAGAFFSVVSDILLLDLDPAAGRVSATRAFEPGEAWADYQRQMEILRELLDRSPAQLATTAAAAGGVTGSLAAFVACEGGDVLEARPERLERLHADGVRSVQLVHYAPNELGDLQTEPPRFGGLSAVGREVVREMGRLGMVVDVAHASLDTVRDVVEATDAPLLLSHTLLRNEGPARGLARRLVTPDHARLVAGTGGVIGAWPAGGINRTLQDFVDATLRLVDVVGVDHVGIGSDMDGGPNPVFDRYGQLATWAEGLRTGGLSEPEVEKVTGGNAGRLLAEVLGAG